MLYDSLEIALLHLLHQATPPPYFNTRLFYKYRKQLLVVICAVHNVKLSRFALSAFNPSHAGALGELSPGCPSNRSRTHYREHGGPPALGQARNQAAQRKVFQLAPAMGFHLPEVSLLGEGFRPLHLLAHNTGDFEGQEYIFCVCVEASVNNYIKCMANGEFEYAFQVLEATSRSIVYIIKYHGNVSAIDNNQAKVHS
ncbi:hypothetical protein F4604DRAFT_2044932 [Suillus subluteus]|nr:hypothetical protein F4604DRAFT_2044932 [Suillus subluteus]